MAEGSYVSIIIMFPVFLILIEFYSGYVSLTILFTVRFLRISIFGSINGYGCLIVLLTMRF